MPATTLLKALHLKWFSQPAANRALYRAIGRHKVRRILECGIGDGQRAVRMIEMAQRTASATEVSYTGIDLFEGRSAADGPGVTLKLAHRLLRGTGAKVHLLPGDIGSTLPTAANSLTGTDLVIISARQHPASIQRAWFYLPRIVGASGVVYLERMQPGGKLVVQQILPDEIERLAQTPTRRAA
ncbi:MAG: hypothetical protein JW818_14555 [Pirellulales bacterium]|nr:hypothetical protein [Pirellulales bacterium]